MALSEELHVGFTGTKTRLPIIQVNALLTCLEAINKTARRVVSHSGDCINADAVFHGFAVTLGWRTVGHIPFRDAYRAFCVYDEERAPAGYLERDRQIVHASREMVACSKAMQELPSGGTWYTIRYARSLKKPLTIVWPNGTTTKESYSG